MPYKTVAQIPQDLLPGIINVATIDTATPIALIKKKRDGRLWKKMVDDAKLTPS